MQALDEILFDKDYGLSMLGKQSQLFIYTLTFVRYSDLL